MPNGAASGSSTPFIVSWLALQALGLMTFALRFSANYRNAMITMAFCAYLVASIVWSVNPDSSMTYVPMIVGNVIAAYLISTDLGFDQILRLCVRVIIFMAALSLALYVAGASQVIYFDAHDRINFLGTIPMRGLFPHKILAGLYMALGLIIALGAYRKRALAFIIPLLCAGILLTGSASALVVLFAGLTIYWITSMARRQDISPASFIRRIILASLVAIAGLIALWNPILEALGRDGTLTGRTVLWEWGIRAFLERPIFGWGFNAYLTSEHANAIYWAVPSFRNWEIPHFHQSFIQTGVDLGALGLLALLLVLVSVFRRSLIAALRESNRMALPGFVALCMLILAGMGMFLFINYNHFGTFFILAAFFAYRAHWPRPLPNNFGRIERIRPSEVNLRERQ
ncbi:O-antigen ligase family protein [Microbacterium sp. 179-B 1A2 NHS]|uniref:O-antigen ligase family protein n=1 Tax=Microbacterium sp. 179-B 1A2 NHS TaxID=3142383 RepID=UPI0039A05C64